MELASLAGQQRKQEFTFSILEADRMNGTVRNSHRRAVRQLFQYPRSGSNEWNCS